jgi:hypothetical protein
MHLFTLLESKRDIANAQRKLQISIRRDFTKRVVRNIGFPGGTVFDAEVSTNEEYWFWSEDSHDQETHPKRLNWFGLYKDSAGLEISVEINTPYEGRDDSIAGFFARDSESGAVYLFHTGRIGGGTKGVGKTAFLAWTEQRPVKVLDSEGKPRYGVLVMPVDGKAVTRPMLRYVQSIADFKSAVRSGMVKPAVLARKEQELQDYYSESSGRRTGSRSSEIDYVSRHGDVVDALNEWRRHVKLSKGARIVKNVLIDLGVRQASELTELYEVKTSTSRSAVYGAIGQLLVHGVAERCKRFIVIPHRDGLAKDLEKALQRLSINIVWYELDEDSVTIL